MFPNIPSHNWSIPWQGFLASEGPKTKAYPYLKTIIPFTTFSWKSFDTIGYQCTIMVIFLNALPGYCYLFPFLLLLFLILTVSFNHPKLGISTILSCTKHIITIMLKINWNKLKSYLISGLPIIYTCHPIYFLSQQVKLALWSNHHVWTYHIRLAQPTTIIN